MIRLLILFTLVTTTACGDDEYKSDAAPVAQHDAGVVDADLIFDGAVPFDATLRPQYRDPGHRWQIPMTTWVGERIKSIRILDNDPRDRTLLVSLIRYDLQGGAHVFGPVSVEMSSGPADVRIDIDEGQTHQVTAGTYFVRIARPDGRPNDGLLVGVAIVSTVRGEVFLMSSTGHPYGEASAITPSL